MQSLYCSPNGQRLRWGAWSANFLWLSSTDTFLRELWKVIQTAECSGKLVSKHLEWVSNPHFKTADFCFLQATSPAPPHLFSPTLLFLWPPKPCSSNFRNKRSSHLSGRRAPLFMWTGRLCHPTEVPAEGESLIFKMICTSLFKLRRSAMRLFMKMCKCGS